VKLTVEFDHEVDGRWIAEVPELPGVMVRAPAHRDHPFRRIVIAQNAAW
jgi:hypothetical protein